jgi:hypothetical protein
VKLKPKKPPKAPPLPRTLIQTESPCYCEIGKCRHAARECRDWIKRSATK